MKLRTPAFIAFSILALIGLGLYSQLGHDKHLQYPYMSTVVSDYSRYVGQKIAFWGDVVGTDNGKVQVSLDIEGTSTTFTLLTDARVATGDEAEVLGTLQPDYVVSVDKIIDHKKWKEDLILVRSAVAIPVLILVFFAAWRFDRKIKRFVERQ